MALRLVIPAVTVFLAGWVQHRLGPGHSGRLVGLPLTSGPFLAVVLLVQGSAPTVSAARGVVTGQLMVVGFAATYAGLTRTGLRPRSVIATTMPAVAVLAAAAHAWLSWPAALAVAPFAAAVLFCWRPEPAADKKRGAASGSIPAVRGLLARAVLSGALVVGLSSAAPLLGPSLAGLLAAVPLVVSVVAPAIHARTGPTSVRTMLRGTLAVVPGTAGFAATVAATVAAFGAGTAFGLGLVVLLTVNYLVDAADRRLAGKLHQGVQSATGGRPIVGLLAER